jgi:hypothetical protein
MSHIVFDRQVTTALVGGGGEQVIFPLNYVGGGPGTGPITISGVHANRARTVNIYLMTLTADLLHVYFYRGTFWRFPPTAFNLNGVRDTHDYGPLLAGTNMMLQLDPVCVDVIQVMAEPANNTVVFCRAYGTEED